MTTIAEPRSRATRKTSRTNAEMIGWIFMRASGVLLVVLIFGHLITNLITNGGVHAIDFGFVAGKWAAPLWRVWDLLMLWLAMIHGTNGVRTIVNDYVTHQTARRILVWAVWLAAGLLILLGTLVIFTFDPCIPPVPDALAGVCPA